VKREALLIDPKIDLEIMGSYRRGAENSGDVDFLITRNDADGLDHSGVIERLVRKLMFMGIITHEVGLLSPSNFSSLQRS
jgi:DNA polymerase lambda